MSLRPSRHRASGGTRRSRAGCGSYLILFGLIASVSAVTWLWLHRDHASAPPSGESRLNAAYGAFTRGDLDATIALSRTVAGEGVQGRPEVYRYAVLMLARALILRSFSDYNTGGDRAEALTATTDAIARLPGDLTLSAAHAYALAANGQLDEAADQARQVLEFRPASSLARAALALAYSSAGRHDLALSEALRAADDAEGDEAIEALRVLATAHNSLAEYDQAQSAIEAAIRVNANLPALYFERALYALQTGDANQATVAYFRALALDPGNVKARLRLCELSSTLREREAALRYCGEVTRRAPNYAEGWYRLGREYFLNGSFEQAQRSLHQCAVLEVRQGVPVGDRRFECWYLQGQAAQILGDCDALLATYREFRAMAVDERVLETWVYPPEGPPGCPLDAGSS